MGFYNLEFLCKPIKHIIEVVRAKPNMVFLISRVKVFNVVIRLCRCPFHNNSGEWCFYLVFAFNRTRCKWLGVVQIRWVVFYFVHTFLLLALLRYRFAQRIQLPEIHIQFFSYNRHWMPLGLPLIRLYSALISGLQCLFSCFKG